jgi:allantoin racemase
VKRGYPFGGLVGLPQVCVLTDQRITQALRYCGSGKEEDVFPMLVEAGMRCVEDGADVICLGSTTMHQSHAHLTENLPVPVINPGPLTYKLAEALLGMGLTHSRTAYPRPNTEKLAVVQAMLAAAVEAEDAGSAY